MDLPTHQCPIRDETDLLRVREIMRNQGRSAGIGLVDLTKFITAGSEIARNILKYAGEPGTLTVEEVSENHKFGIQAIFEDKGIGIADLPAAMADGFSTGGSLGLGLPGAKRLVDEFDVQTAAGEGVRVKLVKWKR